MIEVTEANFEEVVKNSDQPFLLDFSATWCSPCQALKPILEEVATEFDGKAKVGYVDIDQNPQLTAKNNVTSVPTMILFNSGEAAARLVGLVAKPKIMDTIKQAL